LEDFFAGLPQRAFVTIGQTARRYTWKSLAGFAQDDWRIMPRLMLNLGLRYSYVSPIKEANNLWGNFDPARGMVQQGQSSVGDTIIKPDYKNFSPRVGFAWDVNGKGTTIIRGGTSLIYSMFSVAQFTMSGQSNYGGGAGTPSSSAASSHSSMWITTPTTSAAGFNSEANRPSPGPRRSKISSPDFRRERLCSLGKRPAGTPGHRLRGSLRTIGASSRD